MSKTTKVILSGGFHNSAEITIRIKADSDTVNYKIEQGEIRDLLSPSQIKRLDNHFCGISDCCCGGLSRADIDEVSK